MTDMIFPERSCITGGKNRGHMQDKLLGWFIVLPVGAWFLSGWLAKWIGFPMAEGPPPGLGEWVIWMVGTWTGAWVKVVGVFFIWPGEALTGIRWADADRVQTVACVLVSYVAWAAVMPWGLSSLGMWDWFSSKRRGSVSQELHAFWVKLRDWIEEVTGFGKGPAAKWAGMADMKARRWRRGDIFLGRPWTTLGGRAWPVGLSTERHMVTIAGPGSGKSTGALVPNICVHDGGLLCIDPKGELARITSKRRLWRRDLKGGLHIIDPFGIGGWGESVDSYNPFDDMERAAAKNPERAVSFAARIAEALVKPSGSTDSYWDNAAKTIFTGLILYIFGHEPKEKWSLVRLRELVTEGDREGYDAAVAAGAFKRGELSHFDFLIEKMREAREGAYGEAIARAAGSIAMMGEGQRGSVLTTAQEHTAFIDNPLMARALQSCKNGALYLDDFKEFSQSVYVCLPPTAVWGPEGRFLRLFVLMFIEVMMAEPERVPPRPVLFAIDEFPNLGRIAGIEIVAPMMRSYGVRFWAVGQDISQFKEVYPETWTGFIGGAEAVQFMGINHPPTVDFLSDLLGQHVVESGMGERARKETHPLMDRDQVMRFLAKDRGNQIIWFGARRPMKLKICPYFEYLMPWYYEPDARFKEKGLRRFMRAVGP